MLISPQQHILVPTDFSDPSLGVQDEVLQYVEAPSQVHLLHVLPPQTALDPGAVWQTVNDQKRIQQVHATFKQKFSDSRYETVVFAAAVGNPSVKIVEYARTNAIDLIVIASHGRTGMAHFLLGSVAERVVRLAPCPVLVWRSPKGA